MYYINLYCTVYTCSCSKQQRPNTAHLPESKSQRQGNADHRFAARQCGEVPFRFASFGSGQLPRGGEHVKFHQTSWGGKSYHLKVVCVILFVSLKKDVTMFSLVSTSVLQKIDGGCYVSFCIHSLRASKILKQVQMGPDTLPDPADLGLRCWLRLIRTRRSCR